jgi:hypothetical protein
MATSTVSRLHLVTQYVLTHLRRTVSACLPEVRTTMQCRTHATAYTRALCFIDVNVFIAWSRDVKHSSPTATLQQLIEGRHQMLVSVTYARLVQVTVQELMSELFVQNCQCHTLYLICTQVYVFVSVFNSVCCCYLRCMQCAIEDHRLCLICIAPDAHRTPATLKLPELLPHRCKGIATSQHTRQRTRRDCSEHLVKVAAFKMQRM